MPLGGLNQWTSTLSRETTPFEIEILKAGRGATKSGPYSVGEGRSREVKQ
jgi:hypothetical protein